MVLCPKCLNKEERNILFDTDTVESDDQISGKTYMIYLNGQCQECKTKYQCSFSLERIYEKET